MLDEESMLASLPERPRAKRSDCLWMEVAAERIGVDFKAATGEAATFKDDRLRRSWRAWVVGRGPVPTVMEGSRSELGVTLEL